jgi:hydroxymethylpyrimidine pyrophosphatase-like HAD family hydrolase
VTYAALATDYDGTIATHGVVPQSTLEALERFRESGHKLVLVTGRSLDDLLRHVPCTGAFDTVVAENGAHLYRPATGEQRLLGERPPEAFVQALRDRGIDRLYVGEVVMSTPRAFEAAVQQAVDASGLALRLTPNIGSVMILPEGVDKASGLRVALAELGLSLPDTVGVGDAENDYDLLACCGYAVAVANALPCLKEQADWVTSKPEGAGVEELIQHLLDGDATVLTAKRRSMRPDGT